MRRLATLLVLGVALALALAACGAGASRSHGDQAAAVRSVLADNPRFTGLTERDPELIGQAAWYEASSSAEGWRVVVRIGWGDCESGCIHEHRWTYEVGSGAPRLLSETGDDTPPASGISGIVTSGPTCPVMRDPPDPACDDRPLAGAVLLVLDVNGGEVSRAISDTEGRFTVELAPGVYRVEPQPVRGMVGTAAAVDIRIAADEPLAEIALGYDTGIR
jgi:hypothetical protein